MALRRWTPLSKEELARRRGLLRTVLIGQGAGFIFGGLVGIIAWQTAPSLVALIFYQAPFLGAVMCWFTYHWSARHWYLAVHLFLIATVMMIVDGMYFLGGATGPMGLLFLWVILIGGMLVDLRTSAEMAVLSSLLYDIFAIGVPLGWVKLPLAPYANIAPYIFPAFLTMMFILIAFLTWLFGSSLSKALDQAQRELVQRQQAEEQLQRYSAELVQSNEELKRFTYIVSHDLRGPLVNLSGFAAELNFSLGVIRSAFEPLLPHLDEKQRPPVATALVQDVPEALSFIDASVTRMDHFINALLTLSRLGRRELDLDRINMEALGQTTLETLAHQIEQRQARVTVGPLPAVVADRTSMEQIMSNLLNNAVIYLEPGRAGEIEISGERNADETIFCIRDNGRGIAPEDMDKVFAPFRRAGKQEVPGEGMGLAYVQTLVHRHGDGFGANRNLG